MKLILITLRLLGKVEDGVAGIQDIYEKHYSLILKDVTMPHKDRKKKYIYLAHRFREDNSENMHQFNTGTSREKEYDKWGKFPYFANVNFNFNPSINFHYPLINQ